MRHLLQRLHDLRPAMLATNLLQVSNAKRRLDQSRGGVFSGCRRVKDADRARRVFNSRFVEANRSRCAHADEAALGPLAPCAMNVSVKPTLAQPLLPATLCPLWMALRA